MCLFFSLQIDTHKVRISSLHVHSLQSKQNKNKQKCYCLFKSRIHGLGRAAASPALAKPVARNKSLTNIKRGLTEGFIHTLLVDRYVPLASNNLFLFLVITHHLFCDSISRLLFVLHSPGRITHLCVNFIFVGPRLCGLFPDRVTPICVWTCPCASVFCYIE